MPVFDECNDTTKFSVWGTTTLIVDTSDFPQGTTSSIKATDVNASNYWMYLGTWRTPPENWSGAPILTLWVTGSITAPLFVNVITAGPVEHQYAVAITPNVWTKVTIDLRNAGLDPVTGIASVPDLTTLIAIRLDYQVTNQPATIGIARIELNASSGPSPDGNLLLPIAIAGIAIVGAYLIFK